MNIGASGVPKFRSIETVHEVEIVQLVLGQQPGDLVAILADQVVAELRTADAFHVGEHGAEAVAVKRVQRRNELAPLHVGGDALRLDLERCPVEPGAAVELHKATDAEHDVVAAEAFHDRADAAEQDVVAVIERQLAGGRADVTENVVAALLAAELGIDIHAAAVDPVVALVALHLVGAFAAEDDVIAGAADHRVVAATSDDQVIAVAAEDGVGALAHQDGVVAFIAMGDVDAGLVGDEVVALAAE